MPIYPVCPTLIDIALFSFLSPFWSQIFPNSCWFHIDAHSHLIPISPTNFQKIFQNIQGTIPISPTNFQNIQGPKLPQSQNVRSPPKTPVFPNDTNIHRVHGWEILHHRMVETCGNPMKPFINHRNSCTKDGWNPINSGKSWQSTAGFLPSTVSFNNIPGGLAGGATVLAALGLRADPERLPREAAGHPGRWNVTGKDKKKGSLLWTNDGLIMDGNLTMKNDDRCWSNADFIMNKKAGFIGMYPIWPEKAVSWQVEVRKKSRGRSRFWCFLTKKPA